MTELVEVAGYPVALDRAYDPATHLWLKPGGSGVSPGPGVRGCPPGWRPRQAG
jgi:hypothetical protein